MAGKMEKRRPKVENKAILRSMPKLRGFYAKQREHQSHPMPPRRPRA